MTTSKNLAPWPSYAADEIEAVAEVLASGRVNYWTGPKGKHFEQQFAEYCGTTYGIAVANASVALELALEAAGIGPGDDVVVTPRSFIASASCVVRRGGRPVFADVDPDSQNITAETIRAVITGETRAVIPVHHAGWPCDMDGIMELADEHDLVVIEDCAQAHGATYKGRPVGGIGHIGVFSFCQDKIMTTGGEGGMLVTNDKDFWRRAWSIKDHGKDLEVIASQASVPGFKWLHESFGTNLRMTEMQAAIGLVQLSKLEQWNKIRTDNAHAIAEILGLHPVVRVPMPSGDLRHAYYRLYAFVDEGSLANGWSRDRILQEFDARGIPGLSGICPEIYREKAFDNTGLQPAERLPVARELGETSIAFLVHPTLFPKDVQRVVAVIGAVLDEAEKS